jgi:hypothetical protein
VMSTPDDLIRDLRNAGADVSNVWDLVNRKAQYRAAVPVLLDWLTHLDQRAAGGERAKLREGLVRALTVPAARPSAAPALINEFRNSEDATGLGIRWVIGNALSVVADDSVFDEVESLARDRSFGKARQMVVVGLGRSKDPRAVPLLVELLNDEDVAVHALKALAQLKPSGVRAAVEPLLDHPQALLRREAKKALAKLPP